MRASSQKDKNHVNILNGSDARNTKKKKNELKNDFRKLTIKEATELARELGFKKIKNYPFKSHGQPVFKKDNIYITPDIDRHAGGIWKMFDKIGNRVGTFDASLKKYLGK